MGIDDCISDDGKMNVVLQMEFEVELLKMLYGFIASPNKNKILFNSLKLSSKPISKFINDDILKADQCSYWLDLR